PLLNNVVHWRFAAGFVLCAAVMVAVIVDRSRSFSLEWLSHSRDLRGASGSETGGPAPARGGADAVAVVVALVALGPVIAVLSPNVPLTVQPVIVPHWFSTTATHLSSEQVLATYPFATADSQASMPWQSIPGLHFTMAGGGGPTGTAARAR